MSLQVERMQLRAGTISRDPDIQRASPLKRWLTRVRKFDLNKVKVIEVVPAGDGRYFALDGATEVEACVADKDYGPDTLLPCKVYGNGTIPTKAEKAEIFVAGNADKTSVSAGITFTRSLIAQRPAAVAAQEYIKMLGPKFRSTTGVWSLVQRHGPQAMERAVNEVLRIWGADYHVPMQILGAIHVIMRKPKGQTALKQRTTALRRQTPDNWFSAASRSRYQTVGARATLQTYVIEKLLGRKNRAA